VAEADMVQVLGAARSRARASLVRLRALRDGLSGEINALVSQIGALDYALRRTSADAAYYATLQRMVDATEAEARAGKGTK
jgi:hypothetical protein